MSKKEAVVKHFNGNIWVALALIVLIVGLFYAAEKIGAMSERLESAEVTAQVGINLANMAYVGNRASEKELDELKKDQNRRTYGRHKTNFPKHNSD